MRFPPCRLKWGFAHAIVDAAAYAGFREQFDAGSASIAALTARDRIT